MNCSGIAIPRAFLAAILVLSFLPGSAFPQDAVPAEALARIKAATVFVRSMVEVPELKSPVEATGSGFVVDASGGDVLVATNSHVVTHDMKESGNIQLVFHSGTPEEAVVPATIVARDGARDLAILKAAFKEPMVPLDLSPGSPLQETATVYIFGFPYGKSLGEGGGNPELTVGRGSVSSIRRAEDGRVRHIQINGDLNPGNSGGPLVDTTGHLAGIAVAHVAATQIGYAIPAQALREMLAGRIFGVTLCAQETRAGQCRYSVTADVIDPLHRLHDPTVLLIRKDRLAAKPRADDHFVWGRVAPDMIEAPLMIDGRMGVGSVTLPATEQESTPYLVQLRFRRGGTQGSDDQIAYTGPLLFHTSRPDDWLTGGSAATRPSAMAAHPTSPPPYGGSVKEPSATVAPRIVGKAEPGGQELRGAAQDLGDATATPLRLDATTLAPTLEWSADGRSFYAVEQRAGVLRKINLQRLTVERQIDLGGLCAGVVRSAVGLVATMQAKDEALVLDENSLEIKSRFHVPDLLALTSAPGLDIGVAACGRPWDRRIEVLNLRDGKVVRTYDLAALRAQAAAAPASESGERVVENVDDLRMSPDGNHLFLVSARMLHRLGVQGTALDYEEGGPSGSGREERIEIGADSRYVALVNGGGNAGSTRTAGSAPIGKYSTYVFRVDDLQTPVALLKQGAFPSCLAIDKVRRRLYTQNSDSQLMVFKADGEKEREYSLAAPGDLTRQILADAEGRGVLVLTQSRLFWVEFKP